MWAVQKLGMSCQRLLAALGCECNALPPRWTALHYILKVLRSVGRPWSEVHSPARVRRGPGDSRGCSETADGPSSCCQRQTRRQTPRKTAFSGSPAVTYCLVHAVTAGLL